jgi:hypothetical protein
MFNLIAKIVNAMQFIYIGWNSFWWNYHVSRARLHDNRIAKFDADWKLR